MLVGVLGACNDDEEVIGGGWEEEGGCGLRAVGVAGVTGGVVLVCCPPLASALALASFLHDG